MKHEKKIGWSTLFFGLGLVLFSLLPSVLGQVPAIGIPPTNAFDKIHSDNGTISAVNYSMPLTVKGGSGIQVKSNNNTHTLQISSTVSQTSGTYNTTQANNVNINTGGSKINFINGTGATVNVLNSPGKNQVNVTISSTGSGSGVTSLNALTGALNIVCVSGNTTCTTSGGNTITVNTAYNVVVTGGSVQTITKLITFTGTPTGISIGSSSTQSNLILNDGTGNVKFLQNFSNLFRIIDNSASKVLLSISDTGDTTLFGKITQYNSINTAGMGVPAIYNMTKISGSNLPINGQQIITQLTSASSTSEYRSSGYLYIKSISGSSIGITMTYTSEDGILITRNIPLMSTNGNFVTSQNVTDHLSFDTGMISVQSSTLITIKVVQISGTTESYDAGADIEQIG